MGIDISECKKFWAGKKPAEEVSKLIVTHDINMLIGYVEQLQAALKEYGAHTTNCILFRSHIGGDLVCDCGFDKALKGGEK